MKIIKKNITLFFILFSSILSYGQYCIPNRFDATVFSLNQIDSVMNENFGQNYNWQDTAFQNLKMDIYFPKSSVDPLAKRPLIVMIHAGGFYVGRRQHYRYYCREFAKRGFVAATIDYRLGWDFGMGQHYDTLPMPVQATYPFNCLGDSTSSIKALYRALQDQKSAIRYLVHYADTVINVDTNYIFVGGGSAGGVSSLGLQYLHQDFFNSHFGYLNLVDSLGALDSASNSLTETFSLAGIISMWGAIPDTSLITESNSLPTLFIHCTGDSLVPCISSNYYSCSNYAPSQGACVMKDRMRNLNQCYEFNYYDAPYPNNGCHDVYSYDYHIERISIFAKRVMCNDCRQITVENQIEIENTVISNTNELSKLTLSIYPNPTNAKVDIVSSEQVKCIEIYNLIGEKVLYRSINAKNKSIQITELKNGVYVIVVRLESGGGMIKKIVKN